MHIDRYRDHLDGQGRAHRTIGEYIKWVRRLARWAHAHGHQLDTLTGAQIRAWTDTIPGSWSSRKQAKIALRHYYRMIGRTDQPEQAVRVPRKPRARYRGLEPEQAAVLESAAQLAGRRPGMATLAGLYTAARASEIAVLRWDGIDRAAGTIRWWRSKTSEWHEVPLHPVLEGALEQYRPVGAEGYLFSGDKGRPHVSPATVWEWVRQVGDLAGIRVTPHQLRATALMMILEATRDLDAAAEFGGHRDPAVTRAHYTRTSQLRLRAAVRALDYRVVPEEPAA